MASPFDIVSGAVEVAFNWVLETTVGKTQGKLRMSKIAACLLVIVCVVLLFAIPYLKQLF